MKGILLAGGSGTRLYPMTKTVSKQLLPIYDKPMVYYPLSILLMAGIREILIISTPRDIEMYKDLLGDGSRIGVSFSYAVQDSPRGIADAFIVGEQFLGGSHVCLVLGDNVFYGENLVREIETASVKRQGATIFGYYVKDPSSYGVLAFDENNTVIGIEEKPQVPRTNYAVPGLYFYDNSVIDVAKSLIPSPRGEIEITDINNHYIRSGGMQVVILGRGFAWLDTGSCDGLLEASNFIETIQKRQGLYVACIEEIAYQKGFITREQLLLLAEEYAKTSYGEYLRYIALHNQR